VYEAVFPGNFQPRGTPPPLFKSAFYLSFSNKHVFFSGKNKAKNQTARLTPQQARSKPQTPPLAKDFRLLPIRITGFPSSFSWPDSWQPRISPKTHFRPQPLSKKKKIGEKEWLFFSPLGGLWEICKRHLPHSPPLETTPPPPPNLLTGPLFLPPTPPFLGAPTRPKAPNSPKISDPMAWFFLR